MDAYRVQSIMNLFVSFGILHAFISCAQPCIVLEIAIIIQLYRFRKRNCNTFRNGWKLHALYWVHCHMIVKMSCDVLLENCMFCISESWKVPSTYCSDWRAYTAMSRSWSISMITKLCCWETWNSYGLESREAPKCWESNVNLRLFLSCGNQTVNKYGFVVMASDRKWMTLRVPSFSFRFMINMLQSNL